MTSTTTGSTSTPASTDIVVRRKAGLDPSLILVREDSWADFFRTVEGIPSPETDYLAYLEWKAATGRTDPYITH